MMFRLALGALVAFPLVSVSAQDPTKTLPDSYQVQFENAWVKVVRVHYDAGAKLPDHTHAGGTTLYVYLNDSDGVTFRHSGTNTRTVTRPPVKAGHVRIAAGPEEHHMAENTGSTPSDFLRVWFKTDAAGVRNLRQRLTRGKYQDGERVTDEQYSNKQLRVTRLLVPQHDEIVFTAKGASLLLEIPSGRERWIEAGEAVRLENHEVPEAEFLRIDFLTAPVRP